MNPLKFPPALVCIWGRPVTGKQANAIITHTLPNLQARTHVVCKVQVVGVACVDLVAPECDLQRVPGDADITTDVFKADV